jgi:hypothetical protein
MEPVPSVGRVFSPLDEELGLEGSDLTPHAQESLVRLATWVPFGPATELLTSLLGVRVSKASARRSTLEAGEAALRAWEEQTDALQRTLPPAAPGAARQVMSADGAMVPLVGGVWAEVKTLVLGEVATSTTGEEAELEHLSYCSRLSDVPGFEQATLLEVHRRGVEQAREVAAVTDGAEWLSGFIDYHRADALRILDFAHAATYVSAIADLVRDAGLHLPPWWREAVVHRLKHEGPDRVLRHLCRLCQRCPTPEAGKKLQYLSGRQSQMQYPTYRAAGWPIGSGMVESANKLVVEARLKGAGMHWQREHVNALLLLRNAVCNDRWSQTWHERLQQQRQIRQHARVQRTQRRLERATCRLLRLLLPLWVALSPPRAPALPPPPNPSRAPDPTPVSRVPPGRTEAQYRWGRRPVSRRGVHLQAEFAKK